MNYNLYTLFFSQFVNELDSDAIITESGQTYTYREIDFLSAQYANQLTQMGLEKGDRIAVQVEKCVDALLLYLGCLRSGIIYLPLNPAYQKSELDYFITDAEPKMLVCTPKHHQRMIQIAYAHNIGKIETLDDGRGTIEQSKSQKAGVFTTVQTDKNDIAVILYTSGTTGKPKGAMLTHHNLAVNGLDLKNIWGFQKSDTLLHMLPIFHVHGLFFSCHCTFLSASKMIFVKKFNADSAIQFLPQSTVMMGVPTYYTRLLADERFTAELCKNARLFTSGSAPLLEKTFQSFQTHTGHTILERYGMTETGILTSNPLAGERRCSSVGFSLPHNTLRVIANDGTDAQPNEPGDIEVKGENVFLGYWKKDKTEKDYTVDGYFKTGDQGFIDNDGYLHIIGRSKDMIITGGLNVYPKEIEQLINEIPGVIESAVIGLAHEDFGEAVTAIVVKDDASMLREADIISALKNQIANFKVPKQVIFVDALPRNVMGKVQKSLLRC